MLIAEGFDDAQVARISKALSDQGAQAKLVAPRLGTLRGRKGTELKIDFSLLTAASVLFDALYIPAGEACPAALLKEPDALEFIRDAFKHCKTVGADAANVACLRAADRNLDKLLGTDAKPAERLFSKDGVVVAPAQASKALVPEFLKAMAEDRHWIREANQRL